MPAVAEFGGHARERIVDDVSGGKIHIVKTQDCEAVITAMREVGSFRRSFRPNTQDSMKLIGSIPNILALSWAQEWGVKLYSREFMQKARQRLKFDPDWKSLRASQ